jgi:serine/threonine-protein kinase
VQAAGGLGSLAECADVRALLLPVRPPRDAAVRAQVEVLRGRLARAEALDQAGRYAQGLGVVEPLVAEAQRLGYMPLVAAALSRRGGLELRSGKTEAAAATLREAWLAALTAGDEGQAARIATVQAYALGAELSRPGEGEWWAREGQALLAHFGERPELAADLANSLGTIRERQGRLDEAAAEYRRAITLREKALGKDHPSLGQSLNNLGGILGAQGRHAEAIAIFERVLALRERTLGKEHPLIANALSNLGLAMADQGDYAGSQARLERCLAIREKALGQEHPRVGADHLNLGGLLYNEGRYPEALAHLQQADAILEKTLGQEHAHVGQCLSNRGLLLLAEGRLAEARVDLERSLAIAEKSLGKEHPNVAQSLLGLGVLHAAEGRPAEAFESYRRALALREKTLGKEHPAVAEALTERAQLERRSGQLGAARADIERALAIDGRPGEDPVPLAWARVVFGEILLAMGEEPRARELLTSGLAVLGARAPQPERMGEAQLALARALWSSAAERPRALDLAMQARAEYARLPGRARERAEVDAWLAAHRGH